MRAVILASGIYQVLFGETAIGILTLICLAGIMAPSFFSFGRVSFFPIEIEIALFVMVLVQFVIGEARDWYTEVPYYDKLVHAMLPGLLAFIGFLLAYSLVAAGRLVAATWVVCLLIILMSLGAAAVEEICEYASDMILYPRIEGWHHFQGNAQQDPYQDTMTDLVADLVGATIGALVGTRLIVRAARRRSERLPEMVGELHTMFERPAEARPSG